MKERGNPLLRKLDRFFGIPLVFILSFLRLFSFRQRKRKNFSTVSDTRQLRFLFIKTGAVGDSILLSAIALEIKKKNQNLILPFYVLVAIKLLPPFFRGLMIT